MDNVDTLGFNRNAVCYWEYKSNQIYPTSFTDYPNSRNHNLLCKLSLIEMKIKIIRQSGKFIEEEVQKFLDTLPIPSQIINVSLTNNFTENGLCAVAIIYI